MHTNNDNVVSNNLPIYFIWFGSDVPPKYFSNLQRAADTNKSRDIILVYSEKHLLKDNRKNIDSIENIKINEIKERVELKRDSETQNLFKIDVYDMELDKQDEGIYGLLDTTFIKNFFISNKETKSLKYSIASDIVKLPLLNIAGGIYFDMDVEINGEIGEINTKYGSVFTYTLEKMKGSHVFLEHFFAKSAKSDLFFDKAIENYSNFSFPLGSIFCAAMKGLFNGSNGNRDISDEDLTCELPSCIKFRKEFGDRYNIDYNNPEDLKKLSLNKQDYDLSSKLENFSLEQPGSSQEKGR